MAKICINGMQVRIQLSSASYTSRTQILRYFFCHNLWSMSTYCHLCSDDSNLFALTGSAIYQCLYNALVHSKGYRDNSSVIHSLRWLVKTVSAIPTGGVTMHHTPCVYASSHRGHLYRALIMIPHRIRTYQLMFSVRGKIASACCLG